MQVSGGAESTNRRHSVLNLISAQPTSGIRSSHNVFFVAYDDLRFAAALRINNVSVQCPLALSFKEGAALLRYSRGNS